MASTSNRDSLNSSKDIIVRSRIFIKHDFLRPIRHSKNPPHHGALATLNCQLTSFDSKKLLISSLFLSFFNHLAADLKVWALSDISLDGIPRLVISDFKLCLNTAIDVSVTGSIWTALEMAHVNNAM